MKPSDKARRLHPLTIVQRMIVSIPALIFIMLPIIRNPDSSAIINLVFGAVYVVLVVPWIVLYYVRFRFWITPSELIIHSGVITRRKRNIPVERIQNIEIEQAPLQRLLRTAKVAVYTAGSASAEGVLEYVSLKEAREIRAVVREMQKDLVSADHPAESGLPSAIDSSASSPFEGDASLPTQSDIDADKALELLHMSPKRVLLAGAFKFSLLYIAVFFSLLQYIEPDPTVFFSWLMRGPLEPWREAILASPWIAGILGVLFAAGMAWFSGILITFNRYHKFRIELIGDKLHRAHGLMTLSEGTIPLRRIQSYIIRSNPVMKRFGWYRLELQTMGINLQKSGFQVAVPFGRMDEIRGLLAALGEHEVPYDWSPVSTLTIRRFFIRFAVVLCTVVAVLKIWIPPALWGLSLLPFILILGIFRYSNMGYACNANTFAVRRGIFRKHIWLIPTQKLQTLSRRTSFFQRRLGLSTVYLDTAGASPMFAADLVDLPDSEAVTILTETYVRFNPE